jgi:hypothetical protein
MASTAILIFPEERSMTTTRNTFAIRYSTSSDAPDYGKFNVIAYVAPKVKARGMDFFSWDRQQRGRSNGPEHA